ncbi:MAG TPA: hypothetical protein PLQ19_07455 [Aeromicrobium sp.]|nr:hypothetical protein [Aeromicrobium sp.]
MSKPQSPDPAEPGPGQRVRVTSSQATAPAHVRRTVGEEIDEATGVGEVYMRSLIRSQFRAAVSVTVTVLLTIASLPLVFAALPGLNDVRVGPIPLPWVVLGAGVYPAVIALGWLYIRYAERAERSFAALVEPRRSKRPRR